MSIAASTAPPVVRIGRPTDRAGSTVIVGPWPARPVPLRITRRGRLVLFLSVLSAVAAALLLAGPALAGAAARSGGRAPGAAAGAPASVIVLPGETLWEIAGRVAPEADRRDTISRIKRANGLRSVAVRAGTRLSLPSP